MTTIDANGIIRYEDTDGAPTPPVLNLGLQSVSDSLNGVRRRGIYAVPNLAARETLVTTVSGQGNPPSSSNPLYARRSDATPGLELEFTLDGTNWLPVPAGDSGEVACANASGMKATTLMLRRVGANITTRGGVTPTEPGVLTNTPRLIAYLPLIARFGPDRSLHNGTCNAANANITYQIFPSAGTIYARQLGPNFNYTTNTIFLPDGWLDAP